MANKTQTNKQSINNNREPTTESNTTLSAQQPSINLPQRSPFLKPGQTSNYIFSESDLKKVEELRTKILTTPLTFLLTTSLLVYASKKLNLRRLIANPLKDQSQFAKNDKYWRFASLNSIIMGTFGFLGFSFYRNEVNKVYMFKKYEKEISLYMKWRTDRQIREYLKKSA